MGFWTYKNEFNDNINKVHLKIHSIVFYRSWLLCLDETLRFTKRIKVFHRCVVVLRNCTRKVVKSLERLHISLCLITTNLYDLFTTKLVMQFLIGSILKFLIEWYGEFAKGWNLVSNMFSEFNYNYCALQTYNSLIYEHNMY